MNELGLDTEVTAQWFPHETEQPYLLIRVTAEHANAFSNLLGSAVRRCYLADDVLLSRSHTLAQELPGPYQQRQREIIASAIPNAGSVMSGDFGEILGYIVQACEAYPDVAFGPKKWRLKQNRVHASQGSDLVQFILPMWPEASDNDSILCAEVKTKATNGASIPIQEAIEGCAKDRTSRLTKTLLWLRERAILEDLGAIQLAHLQRFINTTDYPPALRRFRALAVICNSIVDDELITIPAIIPNEFSLVIIAVPNLQAVYTAVFDAVSQSIIPESQAA